MTSEASGEVDQDLTPSKQLSRAMLELRLAVEGLERTILASAAKIERRAAAGDIDVDEALEACEEITGRHTLAELGLEPSEAQS